MTVIFLTERSFFIQEKQIELKLVKAVRDAGSICINARI